MNVIARKIAATPKRTADESWRVIVEMITEQFSDAKKILTSITGVASAIIVEEIPTEIPIIITGKGPRIRIYCVYGEDALIDDNCNETFLTEKPTSEEWHMYLPCAKEDLRWITKTLRNITELVTVYDKDKDLNIEKPIKESSSLSVDTSSFLNKL